MSVFVTKIATEPEAKIIYELDDCFFKGFDRMLTLWRILLTNTGFDRL